MDVRRAVYRCDLRWRESQRQQLLLALRAWRKVLWRRQRLVRRQCGASQRRVLKWRGTGVRELGLLHSVLHSRHGRDICYRYGKCRRHRYLFWRSWRHRDANRECSWLDRQRLRCAVPSCERKRGGGWQLLIRSVLRHDLQVIPECLPWLLHISDALLGTKMSVPHHQTRLYVPPAIYNKQS